MADVAGSTLAIIARPVRVSRIRPPGTSGRIAAPATEGRPLVRRVAADRNGGYVGHRRGVTVIDLGTPSAPTTLIELPTAWMVRDLTVAGPGRIVASTSQGGLYQWQL